MKEPGSLFNWSNSNGDFGQCSFKSGGYHVAGLCDGDGEPLPEKFVFEIHLDASQDCGQLQVQDSVNINGTNADAFFVTICQNGDYNLATLSSPSNWGSAQQVMHTGSNQFNTIAIVEDGTKLTLYINGSNRASISANSLGFGATIGLWGMDEYGRSNKSDWREVVYNNARLWSL
jgi:hypothetical protein